MVFDHQGEYDSESYDCGDLFEAGHADRNVGPLNHPPHPTPRLRVIASPSGDHMDVAVANVLSGHLPLTKCSIAPRVGVSYGTGELIFPG